MPDSDEILFKDELPEPTRSPGSILSANGGPWKILIVDDESDVHNVTMYMIKGMEYLGRPLQFFHAYSGQEAKAILAQQQDIAVILLDVVMETEDSGLQLVRFIREELQNCTVRIVLRTGQPGKAPAARVILEYDINDYKEKTELTLEKMLVTVISALRSYNFITTIENNRKGLKKIIEASSDIFERQSLQKLGSGVLSQLTSILQLREDAIYSHASGLTASGIKGQSVVLAATGEFCQYVDRPINEVDASLMRTALKLAQTRPHGFIARAGNARGISKARPVRRIFSISRLPRNSTKTTMICLSCFSPMFPWPLTISFSTRGLRTPRRKSFFILPRPWNAGPQKPAVMSVGWRNTPSYWPSSMVWARRRRKCSSLPPLPMTSVKSGFLTPFSTSPAR